MTEATNSNTVKHIAFAGLLLGAASFVGSNVAGKVIEDLYESAKPVVLNEFQVAEAVVINYSWLVNPRYYDGDMARAENARIESVRQAAAEKDEAAKAAAAAAAAAARAHADDLARQAADQALKQKHADQAAARELNTPHLVNLGR